MKTIILCGGYGTRLKEETEFKPKPMVYIGDKPILWHIMKIYAHYGFNEFILALGYKADYIKDFFIKQKAFTSDFTISTNNFEVEYHLDKRSDIDNFKITFVDTGLDTLPGERILRCQKYIPKDDPYFMVTYGDGVADLNMRSLVAFHKKQGTIGTVTGINPRSKYGLVKIGKNHIVSGFTEKPLLPDWVNGGYMIFDRKLFNYIKPNETEHAVLARLVKKKQLSLRKHNGFWFCVDTYKELIEINDIWNSGKAPWKVWK